MGLNQTDTFLVLKPREEWQVANKEALIDKIREVLDEMPGVATASPSRSTCASRR
jgi:cobalt-zinc-cadmium resistance protein CzcA